MTATPVWEQNNALVTYSPNRGNVQSLPNGNRLVSWGGVNTDSPNVTEFDSLGNKVFELYIDSGASGVAYTYRAFRFEWGDDLITFLKDHSTPLDFQSRNFPNPFDERTTIPFELNKEDHVTITVSNLEGILISTLLNTNLPRGQHQVVFNRQNLASGIYIYTISTTKSTVSNKMIIR